MGIRVGPGVNKVLVFNSRRAVWKSSEGVRFSEGL